MGNVTDKFDNYFLTEEEQLYKTINRLKINHHKIPENLEKNNKLTILVREDSAGVYEELLENYIPYNNPEPPFILNGKTLSKEETFEYFNKLNYKTEDEKNKQIEINNKYKLRLEKLKQKNNIKP